MHLTQADLIRIAKETTEKSLLADPGLVAAYLTGSLRSDNPFLGNTTDIDLVYVHAEEPAIHREIIPLTPEIHLDIIHNSRKLYEKPRELRIHPWLGPELYDPMPLYVSKHFFEFIQAGVRDRYHETSNVQARSRRLEEQARQVLNGISPNQSISPRQFLEYLKTIRLAANALAMLVGELLVERRFLLQFPLRAQAAGQADLIGELFALLGVNQVDTQTLAGYVSEWEKAFIEAAARPRVDPRIATPRLAYYKQAFEAMLASATPQAILWPLLLTWTQSVEGAPAGGQASWLSACAQLGLDKEPFGTRLEDLEHFLLAVEAVQARMAVDSPD